MFLVHAFNDPVTPQSSLLLASALKEAGVPAEVHIFPTGGHGYGLRPTEEAVSREHPRGRMAERKRLAEEVVSRHPLRSEIFGCATSVPHQGRWARLTFGGGC